jgi:hypothetical protein
MNHMLYILTIRGNNRLSHYLYLWSFEDHDTSFIQIISKAHVTSYVVGTVGYFPGAKADVIRL